MEASSFQGAVRDHHGAHRIERREVVLYRTRLGRLHFGSCIERIIVRSILPLQIQKEEAVGYQKLY